MADRLPVRAHIASVPLGADFCEVVVARLLTDYPTSQDLASALILLPNNRAIKAMTEAFVRHAGGGLLMPRMVAIGDLALDEALGPVLDPLGSEEAVAPAIEPAERLLLLSGLVAKHVVRGERKPMPAEALRLARKLAAMIDELEIEQKNEGDLEELRGESREGAAHWERAYGQINAILPDYRAILRSRGLTGPAERRNALLERFAARLADASSSGPVIAAGINSAAKAVANLLKQVAALPNGMVILPGLDKAMEQGEWDKLGPHDEAAAEGRFLPSHETHPQFHLKLLLEKMSARRDEVELLAEPLPVAKSLSDIFCLPSEAAGWRDIDAKSRKLPQIEIVEAEDSAEEAKAISVAIRHALETPGKRVALITPDRELATRVAAQLRRWEIVADDSAGRPLSQTPEGTLLIALAEAHSDLFAPAATLAVLKHPLVQREMDRIAWLEMARRLDLLLRGPAEGIGMAAIAAAIAKKSHEALSAWWQEQAALFAPLEKLDDAPFPQLLTVLTDIAGILSNGAIWRGASGRQLAGLIEEYQASDLSVLGNVERASTASVLRELLSGAVVRPPYGGHPRVAIYGLLEARLQQADLLICGGLNEGTWPQMPQPDPWLSPAIRRKLGLASLERNIGLSAHDLATALGAPSLLLTRAKRDRGGPAIPSRFLLRLQAYMGSNASHEGPWRSLAAVLDHPANAGEIPLYEQPAPEPDAVQRDVPLSITDFDQLRSDPFSFYAAKIMHLRPLDAVDAPPDHAWRGSEIHRILELWAKDDDGDPAKLLARAADRLNSETLEPAIRALWQPRISEALAWVAQKVAEQKAEGRTIKLVEERGTFELGGATISGRPDRIDDMGEGSYAVVDYKKGMPPSNAQVAAGYALQLGLLGLMLGDNGFEDIKGKAGAFEYWSLARKQGEFGFIQDPVTGKNGAPANAEELMQLTRAAALEAIEKWIKGDVPFTAKLQPRYAIYADYDQLMRLQEWDGRREARGQDEA